MPLRLIAGIRLTACVTTPAVTPSPSSSRCGSLIRTGSSEISPGISQYAARMPSTTRLFRTGAHAPGLKSWRVLRIAVSSADRP